MNKKTDYGHVLKQICFLVLVCLLIVLTDHRDWLWLVWNGRGMKLTFHAATETTLELVGPIVKANWLQVPAQFRLEKSWFSMRAWPVAEVSAELVTLMCGLSARIWLPEPSPSKRIVSGLFQLELCPVIMIAPSTTSLRFFSAYWWASSWSLAGSRRGSSHVHLPWDLRCWGPAALYAKWI